MYFSVLLENSLLYEFLESSRFSSGVYIQVAFQAQALRNSNLSFACFNSVGLELFSVNYYYKRWTYILCSYGLELLETGLRISVN